MKILYLVPYTPTTIRTRPYNLIHGLLRQGHQVTLATVWENEFERQVLDEFRQAGGRILATRLSKPRILRNLISAFFLGIPFQANYSWQPDLADQIYKEFTHTEDFKDKNQKYDLIHIEHLRGAIYGQKLKNRINHDLVIDNQPSSPKPGLPMVWDSVDNITALFTQAAQNSQSRFGRRITRLEIPRTRNYEANQVDQFQRTLVTSPVDLDAFNQLYREVKRGFASTHKLPIEVLSNGVDFERFKPSNELYRPDVVLFSGKLSYHANISAALFLVQKVMPLVWERRPQAKLILAGKDPHPSLTTLAKENPQVEVTGTVSNITAYIQQAAVAAATITYGAGVQNKVLEAMACATPVVATTKAVSAIKARRGIDVLVADEPEALAAHILCLLEDQQMRQAIAQNGYIYVRECHNWNHITAQLVATYEDIIHTSDS